MHHSNDSNSENDSMDAVIAAYKKDIDRTLLRENLKLTPEERLLKFDQFMDFLAEVQRAGKQARARRHVT